MNWPRLWCQSTKCGEGAVVFLLGRSFPCKKGREDLGAILAEVKRLRSTLARLARGNQRLEEGLVDLLAGVSWK